MFYNKIEIFWIVLFAVLRKFLLRALWRKAGMAVYQADLYKYNVIKSLNKLKNYGINQATALINSNCDFVL